MICHHGACHCGALRYRYETALMPAQWPVRACQCSFCRRHASLTTSDPRGTLVFEALEQAALQRYRFGPAITDFLVCRHCGVYIGAECRFEAGGFGIVNIRALRPLPDQLPAALPMNYDAESARGRLMRRASRWTPLTANALQT